MFQSSATVNLLICVGLMVLSGLVGHWLGKALRLVDYGWKFGVIFFAIAASVLVIIRGWPPRLGVDLGGGSILVYKVDERQTDWREEKMDSLLASVSKRVNPGGQKEITVKSLGKDMVEIVMPSVSASTEKDKQAEAEEIRKIIRTTGALEFRILASKRKNEVLLEMAKAERKKYPAIPAKTVIIYDTKPDPVTEKRKELAKWCRIRDDEVDKLRNDDAAMPVGKIKVKDAQGNEEEKEVFDALVLSPENEGYDVTGVDIRDAHAGHDENASPDVEFSFNTAGGQKFGRLTGEHVPEGDFEYKLAIVLDDVLETAPYLKSAITDSGRITGSFTQKEVDDIVEIINAGSLPAALEPTPVRDMTTEATLGKDTIRQSTNAMIISSIAVPLFMLAYYHFAGLVAVLVLSLNMLILVALMILIKAPFTLPALAGLALTVGMAVDNNVLIYERLREELAHGAALRMAIRNAFHRVGVVIIDANITHLIAATVLWTVGTEQIKGFAVTFWLGAVLSIWATMFVARVLFEVAERRRWVTKMTMMQWIGHTKIDFMAWFPLCATFSVLITVVGLVIAVVRGQGLFDIDFTGGVSVQTVFQDKQDITLIRKQIDSISNVLPDATVSNAHSSDEPDGYRFIIDTSNSKNEEVKNALKKLFDEQEEKLVALELKATPIVPEKPAHKMEELKPAKPAAPTGEKPAEHNAAPPQEKPSEPPIDKSSAKPGETKPVETKPAEKRPTEAKPADPKPGDAKPAENTPKQSQLDLPPLSLVAMAGNDAVLLAQAESTPAKAAEPKADAKTETKPEPKVDVKPEPKPDKKPEPKAETKPEPKPEPKAEPRPEPKADVKPDAKAESAAGSTSPQSFQAKLSLSSIVAILRDDKPTQVEKPVRYDEIHLRQEVEQALKQNGISSSEVRIDLFSPDGSTKSENWDLKLTPSFTGANPLTPEKFQAVLATLKSELQKTPYFPIEDNIGSAVANDTRFWAVVALVSSWSLIILYLWIRFQGVAFGLAAVIALIHDVLVMLGAIAFSSYMAQIPGLTFLTGIEPFKINLPIVAAFLTIIGYSVNDTIVVFDRIREIRGKSPTLTRQMVNDATNQTLSRTVLTSFTVMMVVVILYIWGGQAVHGFAFALIIGVLTGTYSSIYVAAPILLWLLHPKEMSAATASDRAVEAR